MFGSMRKRIPSKVLVAADAPFCVITGKLVFGSRCMFQICSSAQSRKVIKSVAAGLPTAADVGRDVPVNAAVPAMLGEVIVGELASTNEPDPVSSVTAAARLALVGVARKVATPLPRPATPVEIGSPVALVRVPDDGVPSAPPDKSKVPLASGKVIVRFAVIVVVSVIVPVTKPGNNL